MPEEVAQIKPIKRGKWFRRIPKEILLSPGGVILFFFALFMEIIDWIPIPLLDSFIWELILEVVFCIFLAIVAKIPFKSMVIPIIIERIPVVSDILPTWFIRIFI